jgi:hypothetical protein
VPLGAGAPACHGGSYADRRAREGRGREGSGQTGRAQGDCRGASRPHARVSASVLPPAGRRGLPPEVARVPVPAPADVLPPLTTREKREGREGVAEWGREDGEQLNRGG